MDLGQLILDAEQDGVFNEIASNRLAQFGRRNRVYRGAFLFPERNVSQNAYEEKGISYRTIIANSGARHGAAQRKGGAISGRMDVKTGNSDIQEVMDSQLYDTLLEYLDSNQDMEAIAPITDFVDTLVNLSLVELIEQQRWQMIVENQVIRRGDNNFLQTIQYPTFPGLRATVANPWSNPANDPWLDINSIVSKMQSAGRRIAAIVTDSQTKAILAGNPFMQQRMGGTVIVNSSGAMSTAPLQLGPDKLDTFFGTQGLPQIETYDLQYHTSTGAEYFLKRGSFCIFGTTDRPVEEFELPEEGLLTLENTLGYVAMGRAVGQGTPGRVIQVQAFTNKPPRLVAEGWQETMVVPTEPDAIGVLSGTNV